MSQAARRALRRLERLATNHGPGCEEEKLELLRRLERGRFAQTREVLRLHEALCFLRAYPDGPRLLARVRSLLRTFDRRSDLLRFRHELEDTGVAGTSIYFRFFWFTARWLVERWPRHLWIDWDHFENQDRLRSLLPQLVTHSEAPAFESERPTQSWLQVLKARRETDAAFLVRRFEALPGDGFGREALFESLDAMLELRPGRGTPTRTHAAVPCATIHYQTRALDRRRPDLHAAILQGPVGVRDVAPREAHRYIDLAREAMVTRNRDLDAFETADPRDVRIVDCGGGLRFLCYGVLPERRFLFDATYGFLTLHNGVPIGYVLANTLFESAAVAYNVFESFRGAESAHVYGRVLGMLRHLFGCSAFSVDPYQLGHDNPEGLASGAWWFYYKLGFRPQAAAARRILRAELAHLKRDPRHRSSRSTLQDLSASPVFWYRTRPRPDVVGRVSLAHVGLRIAEHFAEHFGAEREQGLRACQRRAASLVGLGPSRRFTRGEHLAWERWAPLVVLLPGIERWPGPDRRALLDVVRAKGGRREADFVRHFDAHRRLRRAVLALSKRGPLAMG